MNCYVCDSTGRGTPATATCPTCSVALCARHLAETLNTPGPGGAQYRCNHVSLAVPARGR